MTILCNNFIGDRNSNEDKYFTKKINEYIEIFGIFDGHNGDKLSEFVCNYFYNKLKLYFSNFDKKSLYDEKVRIINKTQIIKQEVYNIKNDNSENVVEDVINELVDNIVDEKKEESNFKIIEKEILVPEEEIYYEFNKNRANELIEKLLKTLYHKCNHKIILNYEKLNAIKCGTTALVGIYFFDNLYVANIGDTRLTLINPNFKTIQITEDHNNKNINEKTRILSMGGYFHNSYLFGKINLTRGFGDLWQIEKLCNTFYSNIPNLNEWKYHNISNLENFNEFLKKYNINYFISYEPDIYCVENYKENISIITASDGIWSCMDNEYLNRILYESYLEFNNIDNNNILNKETKKVFNKILNTKILQKWNKKGKSIDNITYIIKFLDKIL
jgi:serine/threonine protein phosphatase PrpC